jgi:type IV pilus assembly protein PilY1
MTLLFTLALGLCMTPGFPVVANAEIAQVPLFMKASVDPNILFVLDDSGSMQYEIMPDDYTYWGVNPGGSVPYVFPRSNGVYGGSDFPNRVATVDNNVAYNALVRSPQLNTLYYNPAVTYLPWVRYDGTSYPDAEPTRALHNPQRPGTTDAYVRNLTANNSNSSVTTYWNTCNASGCPGWTADSKTFWPATYFFHNGGSEWRWANYTRVEISSSTPAYTGHGRGSRTDCAGAASASCSYGEEIQNFANWYSYYRSRVLSARAGIGRAFVDQGENMRVGFGAINKSSSSIDGVDTTTLIQGVRPFNDDNRAAFFDHLYNHDIPAARTPLRKALDAAGQYFSRTDNRGPWGNTPGTNDTTPQLACRNSYTILMTDGYWTEGTGYQAATPAARLNNDGTSDNSLTIGNPDPKGADFTYAPAHPFRDNHSGTLADVAMYYWKRDLCTDLDNKVPVSSINPAFWQHMVTFGVGLGVTGDIVPTAAWNALENGTAINWPDPVGSNSAKIDDLLHSAVNSRGGFFSAADPNTFATELAGVLETIVGRTENSAAATVANSTRLVGDTLIYQAKFNSKDWSGQMIAYPVEGDGTIGDAVWNTDQAGKIPVPGERKIFTWNGGEPGEGGVPFKDNNWDDFADSQRNALRNGGTDQQGKDRLNWIRGVRTKEQSQSGGYLRTRSKILGDIVNSDPHVVGVPNFGYDKLPEGTPGRTSYASFRAANSGRPKVLYVGGNDGMLHAFDASTGVEKFAYLPKAVFGGLANLTSPNYVHQYFVDGPPFVGDAFINGAWKSILVGTFGAGGRGVFALDVTNPDAFDKTKVLWEFTFEDDQNLGYTLSRPLVARMQDGHWAAVFSNGYGSDNHQASLFVVDLETGALIRRIDTGAGSPATPNGLATPSLLVDGEWTIKLAYAGDLLGNLWKFDLSDPAPANWKIAFEGQPLFRARDAEGNTQPITAPLAIRNHSQGSYMIYFGTGKYFESGDNLVGADPLVQSFYALWDNDSSIPDGRDSLQEQKIIDESQLSAAGAKLRVVSNNLVDYASQRGWYLDLESPVEGGQGERVVSAPLLRHGRVIFTTLIPFEDPCTAGGTSWIGMLDALNGARLDSPVFDVNGDGVVDSKDMITIKVDGKDVTVAASGIESSVGIVKTPTVISDDANDIEYLVMVGSEGDEEVIKTGAGGSGTVGRRSWRQLQ